VWSGVLCAERSASPDASTIGNRVDKGRSSAEKSPARYSVFEAADAAAFPVIAPEQGKNSEEIFFGLFFGRFVGIIIIIDHKLNRGFRCYSITGKWARGTAKPRRDNSERLKP
jgi:hypothetical protein